MAGSARGTDLRAVVRQKDDLVSSLRQTKYADLLPAYNGLAYLEGAARIVDGGLALGGHVLKAPKVIITTGARPAVPSIPGLETVAYLPSTSALELEELPSSLPVIRGGSIGPAPPHIFPPARIP